ncbi:MAG: DUF1573 domain-containing protein [Thermoguttaceae bacterium]|nr:DUF1573 domain-containing protein [Thermoguttaceae bacterium]
MASRRTIMAALVLGAVWAPAASAKEWAKALFNKTSHDFGVVARGAKAEYRFVLDNIYVEDVHIKRVTSTCGCTVPKLTKDTLKTYETAELVAELDTLRFYGHKSATLKVEFDKPFPAEVQLQVYCYIRSDVVFEPGIVQFGSVSQGRSATQRVTVSYAGRKDWQVLDVTSNSPHLAAELKEVSRIGETPRARVDYELCVTLKETAPAGYFREHVVLKTNDPNRQTAQVPLTVEGHVLPSLSVSPASLIFVVQPRQSQARNLVVRGEKPFRILSISGPDARFRFTVPTEAKAVHVVPMQFTATEATGRVSGKIRVETDVPGAGAVEINVDGQVVP